MTLFPYGYTFVGKGTVVEAVHLLQHEARVYTSLEKLQGNQIPICFGSVDLKRPFVLDSLDEVVHYLLLSWGGDPVYTRPEFNERDREKYHVYRKAQRELFKLLKRMGVVHGDLHNSNVLWNEEMQQFVAIDFDCAKLKLKCHPNKPYLYGKRMRDSSGPSDAKKRRLVTGQASS